MGERREGSGHGPQAPEVVCFLSHSCGCDNGAQHEFGELVRGIFARHGVELLMDPFGIGVDIGIRIQAIGFHALLFLSCRETCESEWCQRELEAAEFREAPIFVIRWSGDVPERFAGKLVLDRLALGPSQLETKLNELAQNVHVRGTIFKRIRLLGPESPPDVTRHVAQELADEKDHTAVAEFIGLIDKTYTQDLDPTARYHLAEALGKTGTAAADEVLELWQQSETHKLPEEGIREARVKIRRGRGRRLWSRARVFRWLRTHARIVFMCCFIVFIGCVVGIALWLQNGGEVEGKDGQDAQKRLEETLRRNEEQLEEMQKCLDAIRDVLDAEMRRQLKPPGEEVGIVI